MEIHREVEEDQRDHQDLQDPQDYQDSHLDRQEDHRQDHWEEDLRDLHQR